MKPLRDEEKKMFDGQATDGTKPPKYGQLEEGNRDKDGEQVKFQTVTFISNISAPIIRIAVW